MKVHGISFEIDWAKFKPGRTFFIPCLDVASARKEVEKVTKRLGYVVQTKGVIENGVKGLRVWRLRG
jgi:hypothetical protein